jgi:hypothetical protein
MTRAKRAEIPARVVRTATSRRLVAAVWVLGAVLLGLALAPAAGANDAGLRVALNRWSRTIAIEAHSVSLAAQHRHPRRMTYSALRFGRVAVHARAAITATRPSTARGRHAQQLALLAFVAYAKAGSDWAATDRRFRVADALLNLLCRHTRVMPDRDPTGA